MVLVGSDMCIRDSTYDDKGNITSISDGGQEFDYQYERMTV